MGFIYKITNNINCKIYIGKTIKTVDKRYSEHVRHSRTVDTYLYYAMRKYGTENFQIETIEEVPDQNLNDREIYWISFYKSNYSQNGYNCTVAGDGNRQIDIYTIEKISELWNGGLTITEIAKTLSLYTATVKNYLEVHCPTYSKEEQKKRGVNSCAEKNSIKILQFDLDGNYIITYNSI